MTNHTFFVVLDSNGSVVAVANASKAPKGMAYSIASKTGHSVLEVDAPENLMRQAHGEMKRVLREHIDAGACRPHARQMKPL